MLIYISEKGDIIRYPVQNPGKPAFTRKNRIQHPVTSDED